MKYLDAHAHLESDRFSEDLDEVIERCREKECIVINSGTDPERNRETLELHKKYPEIVKCGFGIYPIGNLDLDIDLELEWIKKNKDVCVYVGEIGLDYNDADRKKSADKQKEVFRKVLKFAKENYLPVVIHSRKAELDAIEILEEEGFVSEVGAIPNTHSTKSHSPTLGGSFASNVNSTQLLPEDGGKCSPKVVMHCFNGNKKLIKRCVENGWYFSVPPVITRLDHFKILVDLAPIEQLLTETDAPYLSPVSGTRNEPVNVSVTIKEIAKVKSIGVEEVRKIILENSNKAFGKI